MKGAIEEARSARKETILLVEDDPGVRSAVLVTDVTMPDISGRQLAEMLATERPRLLMLHMSGSTDETTRVREMLDQATGEPT